MPGICKRFELDMTVSLGNIITADCTRNVLFDVITFGVIVVFSNIWYAMVLTFLICEESSLWYFWQSIIFFFRCINGSTLLHTACYYGHHAAIKDLLKLGVFVSLRDYKGATPLHRAKDSATLQVCLISHKLLAN